jgi:hypothetical protein
VRPRARKRAAAAAAPPHPPPPPRPAGATGGAAAAAPAWPRLARKEGLAAQPLLRSKALLVVPGALSPAEAASFVAAAEALGFAPQGSRGAAFGEAFRDNGRAAVHDAALAARLWRGTGLGAALAGLAADGDEPVGLNPNVRLYRYVPGQRFGRHVDGADAVAGLGVTRYTLLIYLSACRGGETVFYDRRGRRAAAVAPAPGLALVHEHGDACMEHEGAAVTGGVKYVLRSDVVFAPAGGR